MMVNRQIKLLFLAFGFSIHALRRVKVFSTDKRFKVHLVSDYPYKIENVEVTTLDGKAGLVRSKKYLNKYLKTILSIIDKQKLEQNSTNLLNELLIQLIAYRQLLSVVRKFKPDAVFLQTLLYPAYLGCFLPASIPKIVTFWNGDLIWWSQSNVILKTFKQEIIDLGIGNLSAATVNSEAARDAALNYGIDPKKLHVIRYPGVDLEHFAPRDRDAAKKNLKLTHKRVVLCPRGLGGYLNSDVLIQAACVVCKILPDTLFLFVSKVGIDLWKELMILPRKLQIDGHFRHDGQIDWHDMPNYYNSADMMVSPSSNDSQPNCMLEAMACGTPVIMGDIPPIREWVTHDHNGILVPPRNPSALTSAIVTLLQDQDRRQNFSQRNLAMVRQRVDSRVVGEKIKSVIQNLF